jgi:hypothetical protein
VPGQPPACWDETEEARFRLRVKSPNGEDCRPSQATAPSTWRTSKAVRGVCANSFDVVEGICSGSKHCGNSKDDFLFAPGSEQAIPVFAFDLPGSGLDVWRLDVPGLLVEHKGHRMFVDMSVCATLSAYGQIFPQRFASIDFRRYREWVPKSEV